MSNEVVSRRKIGLSEMRSSGLMVFSYSKAHGRTRLNAGACMILVECSI